MIIAALMFFFGASAQKLCNSLEHPNYPLFTEVNDWHACVSWLSDFKHD